VELEEIEGARKMLVFFLKLLERVREKQKVKKGEGKGKEKEEGTKESE
jgi:hypothetical protein